MKSNISITVSQAAKILGSCGKTVTKYLVTGKLMGQKNPITGFWEIDLSSIYELLEKSKGEKN
jgi:hypothetical protein